MTNLALCELNDDGESNGRVYYFCSTQCRSTFRAELEPGDHLEAFDDAEPIADTVCDKCNQTLTA